MPDLNFSCSGRISGVTASTSAVRECGSSPVFQVWHPLSSGSSVYSKIGQIQFEIETNISAYIISNVSLTSLRNYQIEFQSGDVIGCYQPFNSLCGIWWIHDANYITYFSYISNYIDAVNILNYSGATGRPLISVMIGE